MYVVLKPSQAGFHTMATARAWHHPGHPWPLGIEPNLGDEPVYPGPWVQHTPACLLSVQNACGHFVLQHTW